MRRAHNVALTLVLLLLHLHVCSPIPTAHSSGIAMIKLPKVGGSTVASVLLHWCGKHRLSLALTYADNVGAFDDVARHRLLDMYQRAENVKEELHKTPDHDKQAKNRWLDELERLDKRRDPAHLRHCR